MTQYTIWWLLAGAAVTVELLTGTFYLLMISIGLVAAAISAHIGAANAVQILVAAIVGGGATVAWHFYKAKNDTRLPANANRDVNLDIGEQVQVDSWQPDGLAQVQYRGAQWTVVAAPAVAQQAGMYKVKELHGNRLVVEPV
jgi:membrane protein implicated in regulation of membrane protease activity